MFFKRIEAVGFKSFANKTTVELQPGVTVVVGPNGCGKSNILDSIKWVLGNQSARAMRGKSMQDVIFAGSASFKPLGMAQVTLTLDNSLRTVDMDYDEIQITRRLFRTGESEYLINRVPCRLRDVHDLFLGTGIGTSSYSILEQGKVDQIINAKPIERRFIFEEAAGISKYKVRKMEALRKLERTGQDLKRLNDLVEEIGRQVATLKRQAGRAERYREYSGELRRAEMELMVLRSGSLRTEIAGLEQQIRSMQDRAEELKAQHAKEAAAEEQGHEQVENLNAELSRKSEHLYGLKHEISDLDHQIQRHRDHVEANNRRLAQIEQEFAVLAAQEEKLAGRTQDFDERCAQAKGEREEAEARYVEQARSYNELQTDVNARRERLESLTAEMSRCREDLSRCENEIRIAQMLISGHETTQREAEGEIARLKELLEGHTARREELAGRVEELGERSRETKERVSSLEIRYAEAHGRIADLSTRLDQTRKELHQRQARLTVLSELKSSFEGYFQGVREVMQASARGEIAGVVGPLANLMKSKQEYEPALEAALGPHLQDIVVESREAARAALGYLTQSKQGRATFRPLGTAVTPFDAANLEEILGAEGVIGHAPGLVEREERLDSVVASLLANTIIVRDIDTAERLWSRFPAYAYVTLAGEVLQSTGAVTGGALESSGLLSREREIQELTLSVVELAATEGRFQSEIDEARAGAKAVAGEIDETKAALHALEVEKANIRKDWESISHAHDTASQNLAKREGQRDGLRREIETKTEIIATKSEEKATHDRRLVEIGASLETEREEARAQSEDFIARGAALAGAKADIEKVNQRLTHLEENRAEVRREAESLASTREARAAEKKRLGESNVQTTGEIETVIERIGKLTLTREELEAQIAENQSESEQLSIRLQEMRHAMQRIQRDQDALQNDLKEKEVRFGQLQATLDMLAQQAREKFDRDLGEIITELGEIAADAAGLSAQVAELRGKLDRLGAVNLAALEEYQEQSQRLEFLTKQRDDLVNSKAQIEASIAAIDETTKKLFHETFESVRTHFIEMFRRLFNGGKADLVIEQEGSDPLLEGGVEILAQPPGKKLQTLSLMSGGEKAMTAISLLFGLFLHKPAPFAILDEIDAPLDDANVERFKHVVMEFAQNTQFIIISHNKQTMALADVIYGVTMEESGVSKLVSVKFEQAEEYISSAV